MKYETVSILIDKSLLLIKDFKTRIFRAKKFLSDV